jgi:hypothetical protein
MMSFQIRVDELQVLVWKIFWSQVESPGRHTHGADLYRSFTR